MISNISRLLSLSTAMIVASTAIAAAEPSADLIAAAKKEGTLTTIALPHGVHEYRGAGLKGQVGNVSVLAGSRMLVLAGRPLPGWTLSGEERYRNEPVLRVFVALDGRLAGIFTFGDALRADARDALGTLRSAGIERMVMPAP